MDNSCQKLVSQNLFHLYNNIAIFHIYFSVAFPYTNWYGYSQGAYF